MDLPQRTVADRGFRPPGLCLVGLATISAFHLVSADDQIPVGFKANRYSHLWERNPFALVAPAPSQAQPGAFDKLALVSWLKDVIFFQNTETNDTKEITQNWKQRHFLTFQLLSSIHLTARWFHPLT